jgi:osmoprotectant transport system substrate-binding protein
MRRHLGLFAVLIAALAVAVAVAGCGKSEKSTTTDAKVVPSAQGAAIRIGVKNFTEQAILGQLYRQALQAQGFKVVLLNDVGSTEITHRALRRGVFDMYPEYVGVLLSEIAAKRARPRRPEAAYGVAKAFEQRSGFTLLAETPFSDSNALGVKPTFAKRHGLKAIADLRRLKGVVRIAAFPEFQTRYEGLKGLRRVYGLRHLRVKRAVKSADRYTALEDGEVHVASVFTTEGQLAGDDYVVLDDPRRLFASGHVAPIINEKVLAAHGDELRDAIDAVTRVLTTAAMRQMNAAVDLRRQSPTAVAREFLRRNRLA